MSVLVDLKNRGIRDVFFLVCDGLKGLPEVGAHPGRVCLMGNVTTPSGPGPEIAGSW